VTGRGIIVVDDELDLREAVVEYLLGEGFEARGAASGVELDALLGKAPAAVVILDVNMPGEDGFSIARRLRASGPVGIIMLTSRDDVIDRVVGLEIGADDYVAKPFATRELLARIRTLLRRLATVPAAPATLPEAVDSNYSDHVWVDTGTRRVRVDLASVDHITAAKDYVVLHSQNGNFVLRHTMKALAAKLDPALFLRVHRSIFVRPAAVTEVSRSNRAVHATLRDGSQIPVASDLLKALEDRMTGLERR
jgi:two-component system, LytTR family, response regulator